MLIVINRIYCPFIARDTGAITEMSNIWYRLSNSLWYSGYERHVQTGKLTTSVISENTGSSEIGEGSSSGIRK